MGHAAHDFHPFDTDHMVAMIAAEGDVAQSLTAEAMGSARDAMARPDDTPLRIADLGAGAGVDACELAACFPEASVIAVDSSPAMCAATSERAKQLGLADRVSCMHLNLDDSLASIGEIDLAWASMSLHHVADVARTLEHIAERLRRGGALCLLERHAPLELRMEEELGRPGIWDRVNAAQSAWYERSRGTHHSHLDLGQLAALATGVGLAVVASRVLTATVDRPPSATCGVLVDRQVQTALRRFRDDIEPADLEALEAPDARLRLHVSYATFTSTRLLVIATQEID